MVDFHKIKALLVGDEGVGKTCLALRMMGEPFPSDYIPKVAQDYIRHYKEPEGVEVELRVVDTCMREDGMHLWKLYPLGTGVFVCCFSVCSSGPSPIEGLKTQWLPLLHHLGYAQVPHVLLGLKTDLRDDGSLTSQQLADGQTVSAAEQGAQFVKELRQQGHNFIGYVECSSLLGQGVNEAFYRIVQLLLLSPHSSSKQPCFFL